MEFNSEFWILFFAFGSIMIIAYLVAVVTIDLNNAIDYCKEKEYSGSVLYHGDFVCYKDVPHGSGVGTQTIYSGAINSEVKENGC